MDPCGWMQIIINHHRPCIVNMVAWWISNRWSTMIRFVNSAHLCPTSPLRFPSLKWPWKYPPFLYLERAQCSDQRWASHRQASCCFTGINRPATAQHWRTLTGWSAFIVAYCCLFLVVVGVSCWLWLGCWQKRQHLKIMFKKKYPHWKPLFSHEILSTK